MCLLFAFSGVEVEASQRRRRGKIVLWKREAFLVSGTKDVYGEEFSSAKVKLGGTVVASWLWVGWWWVGLGVRDGSGASGMDAG